MPCRSDPFGCNTFGMTEDTPALDESETLPLEEADAASRPKAEDAFRTISEVAEELEIPQHVLRFWETRFPNIRPLKRAGGRRYYRPDDVALLRRIQELLYRDGFTIKGVQKLLKDSRGALPDRPSTEPTGDEPAAEAESARRAQLQAVLDDLEALRGDILALRQRVSGAV